MQLFHEWSGNFDIATAWIIIIDAIDIVYCITQGTFLSMIVQTEQIMKARNQIHCQGERVKWDKETLRDKKIVTALTQIFTAERDLLLANRSFAMRIPGIFLNNDHLLCE
jgi:hypothetical protein